MKTTYLALALCGFLFTTTARPAFSEDAPAEPAAKPAEGKPSGGAGRRWSLSFSHGSLKRVLVDDGTGRETSHYYMTMTVENGTPLARNWRPYVTLKVDTRPEAYVAGGFATALEAIRRQEGNADLMPVESTGWKKGDDGKIAAGARKDLVAVFGPLDPGWSSARIEVHGLVNPITTLKVLKYGDKQVVLEAAYTQRNLKVMEELKAAAKASGSDIPQPTAEYLEVRETRARVIEYERDGDEFRPDDDLIQFVREGWEVIGDPKVLRVIPAST
jgi:hypothetical protein